MEQRGDSLYWINEALVMQKGEALGEQIAIEIAKKKNGQAGK